MIRCFKFSLNFSVVKRVLLAVGVFVFAGPIFGDPEFVEGKDYLVLTPSTSTAQLKETNNSRVKVVEFFSYGCPACFKLEPSLEKWLSHKPHHVIFERIPVLFQPDWVIYAKYYLVLNNLHMDTIPLDRAIFNAIQTEQLDLTQWNIMESFLEQQGVNKAEFSNAYHSPTLDMQLATVKTISTNLMVFQVPAIVIDGKYKVDTSLSGGNTQRFFSIVNYLVHLSHHNKKS